MAPAAWRRRGRAPAGRVVHGTPEGAPLGRTQRSARTRRAARPFEAADAAFLALAGGWLALTLHLTRGYSFWADDLDVLRHAGSWSGLLEPYNGHPSVTYLLGYRLVAETSGLSYLGLRALGAACLLAVPVSLHLTTRSRLGPPVAAVLATLLLWYPGLVLRPATLNHYLAVLGGIVCAWALDRDRRADPVVAASLLFALLSAGGGIAVAAAALVHCVCTRARLRRWVAVLVPAGAWAVWFASSGGASGSRRPATAEQAALALARLLLAPFRDLAGGHPVLGALLAAGVGLLLLARLRRHGVAGAANALAWSAALLVWCIGLVRSRGVGADGDTFRYAYVAAAFVALAVVPRQPARPDPAHVPGPTAVPDGAPVRRLAPAVAVLAVAAVALHAAWPGLQRDAARNGELGLEARGTFLVARLGERALPGAEPIRFFSFRRPHGTATDLRALVARYGEPSELPAASTPEEVDRALVALAGLEGRVRATADAAGCRAPNSFVVIEGGVRRDIGEAALGAPEQEPGPPPPLVLWSDEPYTVSVRRFGRDWVELATVPAGQEWRVRLPRFGSDVAWLVDTGGACVVARP